MRGTGRCAPARVAVDPAASRAAAPAAPPPRGGKRGARARLVLRRARRPRRPSMGSCPTMRGRNLRSERPRSATLAWQHTAMRLPSILPHPLRLWYCSAARYPRYAFVVTADEADAAVAGGAGRGQGRVRAGRVPGQLWRGLADGERGQAVRQRRRVRPLPGPVVHPGPRRRLPGRQLRLGAPRPPPAASVLHAAGARGCRAPPHPRLGARAR